MADTRRTLSALQTLLADNATGDISPQDIRDMLVSLVAPYGSLYLSAAAETTITTQGVYTKAAGTTTVRDVRNFDMPANNRLRYTGAPDAVVMLTVTVTLEGASNNDEIAVRIGINGDATGTEAVASQVEHRLGPSGDKASMTLAYTTTLSQNDYLEVFVANLGGTGNMTVDDLHMVALGLLI